MRSPALKAAQKRYDDKRKSRRLSSIYFTEDEFVLFNRALKKSGSTKKKLIMDAIRSFLNDVP